MKIHPAMDVDGQVRVLLEVLDGDIAHLKHSLSTLEALREGVIKRDETGLTVLLENLRRRQRRTQEHEAQRQAIRGKLATILGYETGDLTLSVLITHLSGPLQTEVAEKRRRLLDLTQTMQKQWQLTSLLLQDCVRLNRQLFRTIFAQTATTATYGPSGGMRQTMTQASMVNIHL